MTTYSLTAFSFDLSVLLGSKSVQCSAHSGNVLQITLLKSIQAKTYDATKMSLRKLWLEHASFASDVCQCSHLAPVLS